MADLLPDQLDLRDSDRRKVGLLSLNLKMESLQRLITHANGVLSDVNQAIYADNPAPDMYLKMEVIFAALDECARNLDLAQVLCAKLGSPNVPRLVRFQQAVDSGGQTILPARS